MNHSPDLLGEAKRRLSLSGLMAQLGCGDRARKSARCPFHEDSSASFSLYVGDDGEERWRCFAGCGQGDAIDFLAKERSLSNHDACREFIHLAGVTPSAPPRAPSAPAKVPSPFDWQTCVAAFTAEHRRKLADWRGYTLEFVEWLHAQSLIGLFESERIAFPVHDAQGRVVGCHYRLKEDGSWRYHPAGTRTAPLIIGDCTIASTVWVFESQWDMLAVLDRMQYHAQPFTDHAVIATRGASNARLLAGLCADNAVVCAFAQNDDAGAKWLAAIATNAPSQTFQVVTPSPHKDLNDWTRAGAVADDIRRAIAEAQPVLITKVSDLHATPPPEVSKPVIDLPDEPDEPELAPFPVECLPVAIAGIVAGTARAERVPVSLPAVCALGVVSAAIGAGLEIASGPNRVTRGNLFLLASADSGSGKSETFRLIADPLTEHQKRLIEIWRQKTHVKVQSELGVLKRETATLERKVAKSTEPMERARWVGELEFKKAREGELASLANMPCIIGQDVTTERLASLLRDNREVIFSASADARKLIDNLLGRYNPGKTTDESLYLSAYSGDLVRVDRQGRDAVVLNRPCLSLCWFIQPDLLVKMLDEASLSASGFLPRLLICHTRAVPRKIIEGEDHGISEGIRGQWSNLVADLLATFHEAEKPFCIEATPDARHRLTDYHNGIVDRRGRELADVGAFAARWCENAWRVAVVLHAATHGAEARNHPLSADVADSAIRLVEWFAGQQLDILAKGRRHAAQKLEDEVLELLDTLRDRKKQEFVTARDVHRARIVPTAEAARALLDRMEADGVLTGADITPPHGGKTTRTFRAVKNPVPS